ncbi:MAG: hypothetical protein B6U72_03355 [Candidatus Altiarchaeales archaeon ex4484_2]|nr:MAG: hypothetical protein B6U72_03355 [Candidatus Altiarchaeales archaeon ex4484_2]
MESILRLEYPKNLLEIIVVNDGSSDRTGEIAKRYSDKGSIRLIGNP